MSFSSDTSEFPLTSALETSSDISVSDVREFPIPDKKIPQQKIPEFRNDRDPIYPFFYSALQFNRNIWCIVQQKNGQNLTQASGICEQNLSVCHSSKEVKIMLEQHAMTFHIGQKYRLISIPLKI